MTGRMAVEWMLPCLSTRHSPAGRGTGRGSIEGDRQGLGVESVSQIDRDHVSQPAE
jgi:hypothetical protein